MPAQARDAFLDLNRRFNDAIRDISRALAAGDPPVETIQRARQMVQSDLDALRALPRDGALPAGDAGKVLNHLDLFLTLTDSVASAPVLSRKLLDHLLEEQLEITAGVEKAAVAGGAARRAEAPPTPGPAGGRPVGYGEPGPPADPATARASGGARWPEAVAGHAALPGGRRALTVGSLIRR